MFKLSKLILRTNREDREILFDNFSYVYGSHDRGKTVLLDLIDYMMGDSDFNYSIMPAMKGVNSLELKIELEDKCLWLCRTSKDFYYKLSDGDKSFIRVISINDYKDKILSFLLCDDLQVLEDYKILTGKNIGYRSLSLFNYLPESGVGDITNVFPKSKEIGELLNIKSIMLYIFNKNNVDKIMKLKKRNELLQSEIKELRLLNDGSIFSEKTIRENMLKLSLKNSDSILELREIFYEYKKTLQLEKKSTTNKDLIYLIKASQTLAEEIKYQLFLQEQSKHEVKNINISNRLLEMLKNIVIKKEEYKDIVKILERDILNNKQDILILDSKDYKKSIENLKNKKMEIDQQIDIINTGLDKFTYDEKIRIVNILDNAFQHYNNDNNEKKIEDKEKEIQDNLKTINTLSNTFNEKTIKEFNTLLTDIYRNFKQIDFVASDLSKEKFELRFNPAKISVFAIETKKNKDGNEQEVTYVPGSKARMTLWQLSTYIAMGIFIKLNFEGMPFAEYIAIDAVIQEFAENVDQTNLIVETVKKLAKENSIQIIMTGAFNCAELKLEPNEVVNIDAGLNPAFNN